MEVASLNSQKKEIYGVGEKPQGECVAQYEAQCDGCYLGRGKAQGLAPNVRETSSVHLSNEYERQGAMAQLQEEAGGGLNDA